MSPQRLHLQALESSGSYVFHGSGEDIDILEPHQAHNYAKGNRQNDGPPAVFASTSVDYAVFMAVVSKKNCPLGLHARVGSIAFKDGTYGLEFEASKNTMSQLNDDSRGWVYVFDKKDFVIKDPGGLEYINRQPVKSIAKVKVGLEDLIGKIKIVD